ncbi:MAG: indolepyruvate oxidoreductase subunit beta [Syntrophorhabdus sp. PtaB.Bin006]|nr:MAG: indolepyruvate oxidoreductase subunit beta [Syntrophorhabdus sp. PtaB.Bin006]
MRLEIVCAGIGGRGVLLASTILIEVAAEAGYRAVASDEYGMSQRGGSVVSLVKVGDFESPLIGREKADILLSFEESEFYRNLAFLKRGGTALVNTGRKALDGPVADLLKDRGVPYYLVDADGIAVEKGMMQASNMALIGFFSRLGVTPYTAENMESMIKRRVKAKLVEKNLEVFRAGYGYEKG